MRISINRLRSSHGRGGLEGVRPSSSPGHQNLAEVRISSSAPTASRRSRNFSPRYCFLLSKRSGGRPALQLPRASTPCGSSNIRLCPDRAPQKSEIFAPVLFPPPKRSGGRPALQLPRALNPCGSSNIRLRPARVPQKSQIPAPVPSSAFRQTDSAKDPEKKFDFPLDIF